MRMLKYYASMANVWEKRFERLRFCGWLAIAATFFAVAAALSSETVQMFMLVAAVVFLLPAFIYTYLIVIWHWKGRYRGKHSDLWGALILIETSGWMKLIYLFRHIIPDMRQSGRYRVPAAD